MPNLFIRTVLRVPGRIARFSYMRLRRMLPKADPNWAGKQIQLQNETRNQLQDIIKNLVKANGG